MKASVAAWAAVVPGGVEGLADDLRAGRPRTGMVEEPDRGSLDPRQWRRMSRLTRMAGAALVRLGEMDPTAPLVWGSAFGESVVSSQVLDRLFQQGADQVSPLAFQGSVYNAAPARLSLALGLTGPTETISAGPMTALAAVARGVEWLARAPRVVVVIGDERGWAVDIALSHAERTPGEGAVALLLERGDAFEVVDGALREGIRRRRGMPDELAFEPVPGTLDPTDVFGWSTVGGLLAWLVLGESLVEQEGPSALTAWWHDAPPAAR